MKSFTSTPAEGTRNPLAGVTVELDGEIFRCEGRTSLLELSDLARRIADQPTTNAEEMDPAAAAAAMASMSETLLQAFGDAEYRRFRQHCRAHQTPDDVIVEIMGYINERVQAQVEAETGRPTEPPSSSPDGRSERAGQISKVISLASGDVTILDPETGQPVESFNVREEKARQAAAPRQPAKTEVKELGGKQPRGRRRTA